MTSRAMSAERIARARAACEAATPGPWTREDDHICTRDGRSGGAPSQEVHCDGVPLARCTIYSDPADATLIALARTELPAALDALESARGALRRCAQMECEWGEPGFEACTDREWPKADWCGPCIARAELDRE